MKAIEDYGEDVEFVIPVRTTDTISHAGRCPKPEIGPMPPLYPAEGCEPRDIACINRNTQRQLANGALRHNRNVLYNRELCEHSNCLNNTHRDCASEFPLRPVPAAPGDAFEVAPDPFGILRPVSDVPASPAAQQDYRIAVEEDIIATAQPTRAPGVQPGVVPAYTAPGVAQQIVSGAREIGGDITEATGMSGKTMALIAAAVVGFMVLKK